MGIWQYAPNRRVSQYTNAGTGWLIVGCTVDNSVIAGFADIPTLHATVSPSLLEWPNLDVYTNLQYIGLRSDNGAGADGGPFYVAFDRATAPNNDNHDALLISGSGQFALFPGPMHNIWIRKATAGDKIILLGAF